MKNFRLSSIAVAIGLLGLSAAAPVTGQKIGEMIEIRSIPDFESVFERYHYTSKAWHTGVHEVPRLYLAEVPTYWRETYSKRVPITEKKSLFLRLLAPVALYVNEHILEDRSRRDPAVARARPGRCRERLGNVAVRGRRQLAVRSVVVGRGHRTRRATHGHARRPSRCGL